MGTGLIAPDRECVRGIRKPPIGTLGDHINKQSEGLHESFACGDLVYSGHCSTSLVFLSAWFQNIHAICPGNSVAARLIRFFGTFLFTSMFIVQMWGILATRHHYTVDLTVAVLAEIFLRFFVVPLFSPGWFTDRAAILYSNFPGIRLFGCGYRRRAIDVNHPGPTRAAKVGSIILAITILSGVLAGLALICRNTVNKVELQCSTPAGREDAWCTDLLMPIITAALRWAPKF